jgi:hypothetical protein
MGGQYNPFDFKRNPTSAETPAMKSTADEMVSLIDCLILVESPMTKLRKSTTVHAATIIQKTQSIKSGLGTSRTKMSAHINKKRANMTTDP